MPIAICLCRVRTQTSVMDYIDLWKRNIHIHIWTLDICFEWEIFHISVQKISSSVQPETSDKRDLTKCKEFWSKMSAKIFNQFYCHWRQYWTIWDFYHFLTKFYLTQLVKSVQSPVWSRQLKHLRHYSRRSSGNVQVPSPVQTLDQWEASVYWPQLLSTNKLGTYFDSK